MFCLGNPALHRLSTRESSEPLNAIELSVGPSIFTFPSVSINVKGGMKHTQLPRKEQQKNKRVKAPSWDLKKTKQTMLKKFISIS